jgi:signal peptide peptidase SppA
MPAIPPHNTATVDETWDKNAEVGAIPNDAGASTLRRMYAWVDPDKDPETKAAYKFPHHQVVDGGKPGAANVTAVREALSRVRQANTQIPDADREAVQRHLNRHMDMMDGGAQGAQESRNPLLASAPWAVRAEALSRLSKAIQSTRSADQDLEPQAASRTLSTTGGVAVIPLKGLLTPQVSLISLLFGGGSGLMAFRENFREALASDEVGSILIDIDSPGGSTDLIPEIAAEIRSGRGQKPITAIANTDAFSGAYWLGAQADEFVVTPSGKVGSIGVFLMHEDWSGFNAQMGVVPTYISAGKFKTEGNPDQPLSDEAKTHLQAIVDEFYGLFVADVAAGRGVPEASVRNGFGEGRMVTARQGVALGMADRVESFNETVVRLTGREPTSEFSRTQSRALLLAQPRRL